MPSHDSPLTPSHDEILRALVFQRSRTRSESSSSSTGSGVSGVSSIGGYLQRRGSSSSSCRRHSLIPANKRSGLVAPPRHGLLRTAAEILTGIASLGLLQIYLIGILLFRRLWRTSS